MMSEQQWRRMLIEAVARSQQGDADLLAVLARTLADQDFARVRLALLGFGGKGHTWSELVNAIEASGRRRSA